MPQRRAGTAARVPKYRQVFEILAKGIRSGKFQPGQKLASEAALVRQFRTSRITVGRALRELTQAGLVNRIAGSGTYVLRAAAAESGLTFGLLIPDLGRTEIFEPMCQGIAEAPQASRHALLWGHTSRGHTAEPPLDLCQQYVDRRVSGVFFAPIELGAKARATNLAIVARLEAAGIPIVLLDRCILPYPHRCRHDLVGIDNRRAGYLATEHLLRAGARRVSFVAYAGGAPTVEARIAGFREAGGSAVARVDAIDATSVRRILAKHEPGDGFVCVNDRTAGQLMHVLLALGHRIPQDASIVGIDDAGYASLLPVPLTTIHQPCREIGEAAMQAMLARIERPSMLTRDILVECRLVVRESSSPAVRSRPGTGKRSGGLG